MIFEDIEIDEESKEQINKNIQEQIDNIDTKLTFLMLIRSQLYEIKTSKMLCSAEVDGRYTLIYKIYLAFQDTKDTAACAKAMGLVVPGVHQKYKIIDSAIVSKIIDEQPIADKQLQNYSRLLFNIKRKYIEHWNIK